MGKIEESYKAMEMIWDRIPKTKDGKTIRYNSADIDYLYYFGFVDTRKKQIEEWRKAFEPFKQADGWFELNKKQFLSLTPFRYTGLAHMAWDPMTMRDGSWTTSELEELYHFAVSPSSELNLDAFWAFINSLKNSGRIDGGGNLLVDFAVKTGFKELIDRYPSPRRRLEKEVERLTKERSSKISGNSGNRDASGFTVGKTQKENTLSAYEKLKSSSAAAKTENTIKTTGEEIDIKKLRRPTGKMRG